ncbi:MAG: hypothetical protein EA424_03915 [Planctomycetaceae bacterium]|nr:MAG: hypothetical protein EA424_03915 [Planctomycetaceae bacterium]
MNDTTGKPDESTILDHAESPYHRGRAPNASCAHSERNAACGDWVRLELVLEAGSFSSTSAKLANKSFQGDL